MSCDKSKPSVAWCGPQWEDFGRLMILGCRTPWRWRWLFRGCWTPTPRGLRTEEERQALSTSWTTSMFKCWTLPDAKTLGDAVGHWQIVTKKAPTQIHVTDSAESGWILKLRWSSRTRSLCACVARVCMRMCVHEYMCACDCVYMYLCVFNIYFFVPFKCLGGGFWMMWKHVKLFLRKQISGSCGN